MISREGRPRTILISWQPPMEANGRITGKEFALQTMRLGPAAGGARVTMETTPPLHLFKPRSENVGGLQLPHPLPPPPLFFHPLVISSCVVSGHSCLPLPFPHTYLFHCSPPPSPIRTCFIAPPLGSCMTQVVNLSGG